MMKEISDIKIPIIQVVALVFFAVTTTFGAGLVYAAHLTHGKDIESVRVSLTKEINIVSDRLDKKIKIIGELEDRVIKLEIKTELQEEKIKELENK